MKAYVITITAGSALESESPVAVAETLGSAEQYARQYLKDRLTDADYYWIEPGAVDAAALETFGPYVTLSVGPFIVQIVEVDRV